MADYKDMSDEDMITEFFAMAVELTNRFNRGDMQGTDEENFLDAVDEIVGLVDLD